VGGLEDWSRLPVKMLWVWTSDYDCPQAGGEKYKRNTEKNLKNANNHAIIYFRDIFYSLLLAWIRGQRPKGGNEA
jgi:hypothetical protein